MDVADGTKTVTVRTIHACAKVVRSAAQAERDAANEAADRGEEEEMNMRLHAAHCLDEVAAGFLMTANCE